MTLLKSSKSNDLDLSPSNSSEKVANQAIQIQRERYPIFNVEEIVQENNGVCHFSKLNLC